MLQAKVALHEPVGKGYYRLLLSAPEVARSAVPGSFVMLRVTDGLDPLLARPFGISSVIANRSIEIFYRVIGKGTSLLTRVARGSSLLLLGPLGNGFPKLARGRHILIAGGSGFPPLLFLSERLGARAEAHLLFGSRGRSCLLPEEAIRRFRQNGTRVHIATEDGSRGRRGLVTDLLQQSLLSGIAKGTVLYACGPRPMLAAVARFAEERSLPCYVSMEERMACGLGVCMGCSVGMRGGGFRRVCKEGPVFEAGQIDWKAHLVVPLSAVRK